MWIGDRNDYPPNHRQHIRLREHLALGKRPCEARMHYWPAGSGAMALLILDAQLAIFDVHRFPHRLHLYS